MIDFDFLPAELHRQRKDRRLWRRYARLVGMMVVAMGAWAYAHFTWLGSAEKQLNQLERQRQQIRIHRASLELLTGERDELAARRALVERLEDDASMQTILVELSRSIPATVAPTELLYSRSGSDNASSAPGNAPKSATSTQPADLDGLATLRLTGIAKDGTQISECAAGLAGSRMLTDVSARSLGDRAAAGRRGAGFEVTSRVLAQSGGKR